MAIGKNICVVPFTQITYGAFDNASPCPYLGGDIWHFDSNTTLTDIWLSPEYEALRQSFKQNDKNEICSRCWREEEHGKQSARKLELVSSKYKKDIINTVEGEYKLGPKQINLRVSNICNLRCRPCNGQSSSTYSIEGKYYEEKNNLPQTTYTRLSDPTQFSDKQIDGIYELSDNLRYIGFYGGEPLVDKPTLRLLEKLVESGRSKQITLYYNTNGISVPTAKHLDLWRHFESLEFKFSIDAIGEQFAYIRHPGKWQELLENVNFIKNDLSNLIGIPVSSGIICTVQILNVFYLPEITSAFDKFEMAYFLNLVTKPAYYDIRHIPTDVKQQIIDKLSLMQQKSDISSIISILKSEYNPKHWEEFKFWTKQKDAYRKENFAVTFPEYFKIINELGHW